MYSNRVLERNDHLRQIPLSDDDKWENVHCHSMVEISPVIERNVLQLNRLDKTKYHSMIRFSHEQENLT